MLDAVHIHRSSDWFDSEHLPIPRAEWDGYVARYDDLVPYEDDAVLWTGHPDEHEVVLDWVDGRITVHQADEVTLGRLGAIADDLLAVLQGDDCEVYGGDGSLLEQDLPDPVISAIPLPEPEPPGGGATSRGEFLRSLLRRE
jgi:hypothetical protein